MQMCGRDDCEYIAQELCLLDAEIHRYANYHARQIGTSESDLQPSLLFSTVLYPSACSLPDLFLMQRID
jgi:hypothetical protein